MKKFIGATAFIVLASISVSALAGSGGEHREHAVSSHQSFNPGSYTKSEQRPEYVPGEVLVKFKPSKIDLRTPSGKSSVQSLAAIQHMQKVEDIAANNISVMKILGKETVEEKVMQLEANASIEYAEPNYIRHIQTFNDTYSGNLRGIPQISGYQAYTIFTGNANTDITGTIVAVIDVGVAYDHPDLINQMRNGANCKDQSGNALGGCLYGYDFVDNDKNPYPIDSDHGTHVAGTIAAEANNSKGIFGVNFNARIMAIKAGDTDGLATSDIIKSIDFATQNGAKVINASFGGSQYSQSEYDAVNRFKTAGGIFVAAAGNDGKNNDGGTHSYPCDFDLDNIICVAATNTSDGLAYFSNYGATSVDVGAPGTNIYSTLSTIVMTTGLFDDFESVATGSIPSGRTTGGIGGNARGVYNDGWTGWYSVLYPDYSLPYISNVNSTIQKTVNVTGYDRVVLDFWTMCDTEYSLTGRTDYMMLEASSDGSNFTEVYKWDEAQLDYLNGDPADPTGGAAFHFTFNLTGAYSTENFTYRFRRVTNASDNSYNGCIIDDMLVKTYKANTSSEPYGYMDGTSMASPHVAGLVSLAWSMKPELGYQAIKSVILGSGDSLAALSGKTVSGKRINAYNTLVALGGSPYHRDTIYSAIGNSLSGTSIQNNFSTVTNSNAANFSGLYFAAMSGGQELGRITFATGLDLTDTGTQNFLSGELPNAIGMQQGKIRFSPGTGFSGKQATLTMYLPTSFSGILSNIDSGSFIVREGTGRNGTGMSNSIITAIRTGACLSTGCSLYMDVAHFTSFELKPQLVRVHILSDNTNPSDAKSGNIVTLSFTGSEMLTGVSVSMNGLTGAVTGSGISRYSSFTVTGGTVQGGITFAISFSNLSGTSGNTVTTTTDGSSVKVDTTAPTLSGAASVTNTTTQTPSYVFTSNETGIITYTGGCSSSTTSALSGSNTITFATLANGTYAACKISVIDAASNQTTIDVPVFTVSYTAPSGGGGGGGGGTVTTPTCTLLQLICSGGIYVIRSGASCEGGNNGKSCSITTGTTLSGKALTGNIPKYTTFSKSGSIIGSPFGAELNTAYLYAFDKGITTIGDIRQADMTGTLIRKHLAKMISNFAIKQLGKTPNTGMACNFSDMANETAEMKLYAKLACQLGLMGLDTQGNAISTFSPDLAVTRGQFGTVLSRTLRGNTYNGPEPFYAKHLQALQNIGIMKQVTMPRNYELRGYVMLMLMRATTE